MYRPRPGPSAIYAAKYICDVACRGHELKTCAYCVGIASLPFKYVLRSHEIGKNIKSVTSCKPPLVINTNLNETIVFTKYY